MLYLPDAALLKIESQCVPCAERFMSVNIVKPEALKRVFDLINHRLRKFLDYRTT
jgi:hypothetical protein